jgi:CheY-like chemotaxis protein
MRKQTTNKLSILYCWWHRSIFWIFIRKQSSSSEGYSVTMVENNLEDVEACEDWQFWCVVSFDIKMPEMNGVEWSFQISKEI